MTTLPVRLTGRSAIAERTMAFHFTRPAGFDFRPGQAIDLALPGEAGADSSDLVHAFSLVSTPDDDELVVATRLRDSPFKRTLAALPPGAEAAVDGPFGSLTLPAKGARPAVLVAGGIGVTPFMSMLRHAARHPTDRPLVLLYSNRRPEDAAFLAELQALQARHPGFRLVATMTDMAGSGTRWDGPTQRIDAALLRSAMAGLASPLVYLCGATAMVEALRPVLAAAGVDEDDVRTEQFHGY